MTEKDWVKGIDPEKMLFWMDKRISNRKARLLCVAFCHSMWACFTNRDCRIAIEVAERFADNQAGLKDLRVASVNIECNADYDPMVGAAFYTAKEDGGTKALHAVRRLLINLYTRVDRVSHERSGFYTAREDGGTTALHVVQMLRSDLSTQLDRVSHERSGAEDRFIKAHTDIIHDIFGNPFHPTTVDPRWLTSNVVDLARTIYEERVWQRLPILADALMDAGCADATILEHCKGPGPHTRGCWLVDLILGKN